MILEALTLFALYKLATRSAKKKVLVRRRRRSTARSVAALVGLGVISGVLGSGKKKRRATGSRDIGYGPGYSDGWNNSEDS
jgi:hypothetical protein